MRQAWGEDLVVEEINIARHIYALRGKLGGEQEDFIQTCPGRGYKFTPSVDIEGGGMEESEDKKQAGMAGSRNSALVDSVSRSKWGFEVLPDLPENERADIFYIFGQKASAKLIGSEQNTWLDFIEGEYTSFREALDFYGKESASRELELASNLAFYWDVRGCWAEGRDRLKHALERQGDGDPEVKAKALTWFGALSFQLDDYKNAKEALSGAVAMSKKIEDDSTLALALHGLARVAEGESRYVQAGEMLRQSLVASERAKSPWIMGQAYRVLGTVAQAQGDYVGAKDYYLKSLAKREEIETKRGLHNYYSRLSVIALAQRDLAGARFLLDKTFESMYGSPGKPSLGVAQFNLGLIEETSGGYEAALSAFQRCLALRLEIGEKRGVARAMEAAGKMLALLGREKEGARMFGAASAYRHLAGAPMSPSEQKKYGWFVEESQKKFLKEFEGGSKRVLAEAVIV